jgi:hypothetical protein
VRRDAPGWFFLLHLTGLSTIRVMGAKRKVSVCREKGSIISLLALGPGL